MDTILWLTPDFTQTERIVHGLIFLLNISLLFAARPLLALIEIDETRTSPVRIFRAVNIVILVLHVLDLTLLKVSSDYENAFIKLGLSLAAVYTALYGYNLLCFLSRKRFGNEKVIDDKKVYIDTYSTRLVDLLCLSFIIIFTIYALIKIWGADSMLETTGIFGIVAAFLAFTSASWAPDIISGLIVLNTRILQDGDVVVVDGYPDEYVISKVTLIYIVLYDIRNNHRTLIRNSQFIKSKIDNLSRIASTDGIRQALRYNIGYPQIDGKTIEERSEQLQHYRNRIERIFRQANEQCSKNTSLNLNVDAPFECALTLAGDYALEYTVWFYLGRLPNTKITATIRRHLMGTIYSVNEAVFSAAEIEGISLSTPQLNNIQIAKDL
ncbi:mechanosensitive ion channel family protein [Teredinibacter purpureus]|uniref:mechanosensitive ion channel family protein n=1 Tax=Teredinibacter purpureus TaxID=2731756 RepID=UPI0005F777EB|nr:mechanosensitive ion channel family protein [Teredinibacter purpureus]